MTVHRALAKHSVEIRPRRAQLSHFPRVRSEGVHGHTHRLWQQFNLRSFNEGTSYEQLADLAQVRLVTRERSKAAGWMNARQPHSTGHPIHNCLMAHTRPPSAAAVQGRPESIR